MYKYQSDLDFMSAAASRLSRFLCNKHSNASTGSTKHNRTIIKEQLEQMLKFYDP